MPQTEYNSAPRFPRTDVILLFTLLVSYAYFHTGGGPSQNSRYSLTRRIVRTLSLTIDPYQSETIDKAFLRGHYYSDKAPGLAVVGIPGYAVSLLVPLPEPAPGVIAEGQARLHVTSFLSVGVVSALGGLALLRLLRLLGAQEKAAICATLAWGLGTPAFGYATTFMSHGFVSALLMASMYLARRARGHACPRRMAAGAGAAAAMAVVSEYPAAVVGLMLFAYVRATSRSWKPALCFVAGAAPFLLPALAYNWACFGAPWLTGYAFEVNDLFRAEMARGYMGLSYPRPRVMWQLLCGGYRGLLPIAPFLALAIPGFVVMWRQAKNKAEWAFCLAVPIFYTVFASSYYLWEGGCSMGPRHMVPMLPFLAVPTAFALGKFRITATALITYSLVVCLMSVATFPEFPDVEGPEFAFPVRDVAARLFAEGRISDKAVAKGGILDFVTPRFPQHEWDAYNLGEVVGLRGRWSLAPLLAWWGAAGWLLFRRGARKEAAP